MFRNISLRFLLISAVCIASSGCLTQRLLADTRLYMESVSAVFITSDSEKLAVIGSQYDYVFTNAKDLSEIIKNDAHKYTHASMSFFTVGSDNSVNGTILLSIPVGKEITKDRAESLGFKKRGNAEFFKEIQISGLRYKKNPELKFLDSYKLNETYQVSVQERVGRSKSRLLLTPITAAADGAVLLFAIPVVTFMLGREANPSGH